MVAFNFKAQFAGDVESGKKKQSIRRSAKCKPTDNIQLYTGQRTKSCRKLGNAICQTVTFVRIEWERLIFEVPEGYLEVTDKAALDKFAANDGFKNWRLLCLFFYTQYGDLPFEGYLHTWTPTTNKD